MNSVSRDVADIDFADLTSPKLTDIQRQILQYTEARPVIFSVDQMIAEAIKQAGVGDLDDADGFGDRLAPDYGPIVLHPLVGGMPVDQAWNSVEMFVDK